MVDPNYTGYLAAMPNASSPTGPALFEVDYDLISSGTLTLVNGGQMNLHQNCTFAAVTIEGVPLSAGTYSYAQLSRVSPTTFCRAVRVASQLPLPSGPPGPSNGAVGLTATTGNAQVNLSWNASSGSDELQLQAFNNQWRALHQRGQSAWHELYRYERGQWHDLLLCRLGCVSRPVTL